MKQVKMNSIGSIISHGNSTSTGESRSRAPKHCIFLQEETGAELPNTVLFYRRKQEQNSQALYYYIFYRKQHEQSSQTLYYATSDCSN
jgi:hypothetical protein